MRNKIILVGIVIFNTAYSWQITFSCGAHGKRGADIDMLLVKNTDGKSYDSADDAPIVATAKKISVGKKVFKDIEFTGTRVQSVKGMRYLLEPTNSHKEIKSVSISSDAADDSLGNDELVPQTGKAYSMTCVNSDVLDCNLPLPGTNVPKNSVWVGDCESGYWISIERLKPKSAKLKIYTRTTGELEKEGWFAFSENCRVNSEDVLRKEFVRFDGDSVILKRVNPKEEPPQNCYMKLEK